MHRLSLIFFCIIIGHSSAFAQEEKEIVQIQPTIMVIPYTKQGEDVRTILEADISRRVAVSKVKEGFDNRGFTTVDFVAKLKATDLDATYTSGDLSDVKSQLIEASGADIYVEVEAYKEESSSGNSARIILRAYDAFTGRALGDKTGASPKIYTDDYSRLVEKALSRREGDTQVEMVEDFLNVMQEKFTDIIENGRPIKVIFTLDQNATYDFDTETSNGELLSDVIHFWVEENAYKNNFRPPGMSDIRLTYDEVRIPLRDERGRNFTPNRFAGQLRNFCQKQSLADAPGTRLEVDRDVRGGVIYISFK